MDEEGLVIRAKVFKVEETRMGESYRSTEVNLYTEDSDSLTINVYGKLLNLNPGEQYEVIFRKVG